MRNNHPVSHNVYDFPADQTLISVTDLKGRITYCNASFVSVSGYAREELMGQPHNLVRHPDMPEEAFRDLWATIESGRPWTGLVKNRRKNGDHYWVRANATPEMTDGEITGFISIRSAPSRDEIKAAEALEREGAIVVAVAVVVDRDTGAREIIEGAGYEYRAALGLKDLGLE